MFDGVQTSTACSSDKNRTKIEMSVECWWTGNDKGKLNCWERNII
jgi:hypothetical protein